jgi:hypothetical protein
MKIPVKLRWWLKLCQPFAVHNHKQKIIDPRRRRRLALLSAIAAQQAL